MNAIPWYRSAVLQGILTALAAQLLARVKAKYHLDFAVYGVTADAAAQWALDAISAAAIAYAAHGRVAKPLPALTLTRGAANAANAADPSTPAPVPAPSPPATKPGVNP